MMGSIGIQELLVCVVVVVIIIAVLVAVLVAIRSGRAKK
jgi:hypothetical protein